MKYPIIIVIICLLSKIAVGQNNQQAGKFIDEIVRRDNIIYEDSISKGAIIHMRAALRTYKAGVFNRVRQDSLIYTDNTGKQSTISRIEARRLIGRDFYNRTKSIILDSLVLSEAEKIYIYAQLDKMEQYKWSDNLVANSKIIATNVYTKKGWTQLNKEGIGIVYNFSVPIFIRDETFCFFYNSYSCGWRCGQGEFAIYKKESGKWVKFAPLISMIS